MLKRPDGRTSGGTLRPLACELSCLHRADGSALWKAGATHVLAAVHGPVVPRQQSKEDSYRGLVTVLLKSGTAVTLEREWESFLSKVLMDCVQVSHYPRTVIQVVVQVIQSDGSVLSCALHAAVAALLDAGVVMLTLPVATTCFLAESWPMRLDPTAEEEENDKSCVVVLVNDSTKPDELLGCQTMGEARIATEMLGSIISSMSGRCSLLETRRRTESDATVANAIFQLVETSLRALSIMGME